MLRTVEALLGSGLVQRVETMGRRRGFELTREGRDRVGRSSAAVAYFEDLLITEASPEHAAVVLAWLRSSAVRLRQLSQAR